jgi:hypothetical protein
MYPYRKTDEKTTEGQLEKFACDFGDRQRSFSITKLTNETAKVSCCIKRYKSSIPFLHNTCERKREIYGYDENDDEIREPITPQR